MLINFKDKNKNNYVALIYEYETGIKESEKLEFKAALYKVEENSKTHVQWHKQISFSYGEEDYRGKSFSSSDECEKYIIDFLLEKHFELVDRSV